MSLVTSCPTCGARVDAPPQAAPYVVQCHYCGMHIPIEPLEAPHVSQPEIREIRIEIPAEVAERVERIEHARAKPSAAGRAVGCIVGLVVLLPVLIPVGIFVVPWARSFVGAHFGSFPITVPMNDSLEISDREATSDDTLVTVGINGKLTLRRCKLKGPMIVRAGTNAEITIVDSTLDGAKGIVDADEPNVVVTIENSTLTSAEEIVDDGATNVKVVVRKNSKLTAAGVAIPIVNNGEVTIDHATVEGKLGGVEIKNNGKLKMSDGAVVKSDGPAIDLALNGHVQIASSRVESKTVALHAQNAVEGTIRASTLVGPRAALDVGVNGHLVLAQATLSGPKAVGRGSSVEER